MLHISTPYGDHYEVNASGQISYPGLKPSGQWRMLGIQHVKANFFIPFAQLTPERVKNLTLLYKNGHPQWTVRDSDHGTTRVWGNTHAHGIKYLYFD